MYDISIVIVNFNIRDVVDACIESIYKSNSTNLSLEIFFVDNHSIDGSAEHIRKKYPEVKVIENKENLGFGKANNIALRQAEGRYILLLNPDTVLMEGTFDKLIKFAEKEPMTGAVTSKLIKANGELDIACRRSFPTMGVAIPRILGLSKIFPKSKTFGKYNLTYLDENETYEVDAICGAFMFIPKLVLDKTGYFDEDYFMYGEDLDLCYRIKKNNFKIFYYPEITTVHLKGESTRKAHLSYVNNFYGAMAIFVRKNLKSTGMSLLFLLRFGILLRSLVSYLKRIFLAFFLPLTDIIVLFAIMIFAVNYRFNIFPPPQYIFILSIYISIWVFLMAVFGLYTKKYHTSIIKTFNAIAAGFFINSSITYFLKQFAFSREVVLVSTVLALIILSTWRGLLALRNFIVSKNITLKKINLLIVGEKTINQNIEDKLRSKHNVLHFNKLSKNQSIDDLKEIININEINEIIFSGDKFSNRDILSLMKMFGYRNLNFKIIPTGNDLILTKLSKGVEDISLIELEYNINNKLNRFLKRLFDICISLITILTIYPLALLLKKIFNKNFSKHFEKILLIPKVIKGNISLVGSPVWYDNNNEDYIVKPGLTGPAQLENRDNLTTEELENYNIFYAKNQSILLDVEILLKTIFSYFRK